jgi:uncharacterized protein YndB with AHSA1/START domain
MPDDPPGSFENTVEVPGTPEQVWEAIATGPGTEAWFVPAEIEGRVGGRVASGDRVHANVHAYLYGDEARPIAAREAPRWRAWMAERL